MSTTSRLSAASRALVPCALALGVLGGCLPGPWEYRPSSAAPFRGITVSAYAVADRPVENVCFEKLLALDEASAEAFAFYDDDSVTITGTFSDGPGTLLLTPNANTPNCFTGPAGSRFLRGQAYALRARFVWDSAGAAVTSVLEATASVPAQFGIADTAYAPALVTTGAALDGITDSATFMRLPPGPRALFLERYGDTLLALQGDSAGLAAWEAENGQEMRRILVAWMRNELTTYRRGDSVYYLSAKDNLSNLSHFFKARRDAAVKGVLITHRFDTTGMRPTTSFDSLFGIAPDTSAFYYPGDIRRLIFYGDYINPDGRHIFDSLGFVNAWFWSGRNRIYFYGVEKIYSEYLEAANEQYGNPKVRLPTNVSGGRGYFAGMIVDSFEVHIRLDDGTQAFPYAASRAAACRDKGWWDNRDCIGYYPEYCAANGWAPADCRLDAMYRALHADSASLPPAIRDSARAWRELDPLLGLQAAQRYCIDANYPADVPACAVVRSECEDGETGNPCQLILWKRCQLAYWKLPACAEGILSYCDAKRDVERIMCRDVPEP